jgi:putative addiction module killer protein
MIQVVVYETPDGREPFKRWLSKLDVQSAKRVAVALNRLGEGNTGNLKSVGDGVFEIRLTFGAGIRVYLGREGDTLVILLHGGTKHRQSDDIAKAKQLWRDYKAETTTEGKG